MKKFLAFIVVVALAGGGFYWYTQSGEVLDEAAPVINSPASVKEQMMDMDMMKKIIPDEPQEEEKIDDEMMEKVEAMIEDAPNMSEDEKMENQKEMVMMMNPELNEEAAMDADETVTAPKMMAKGIEMAHSEDTASVDEGNAMIEEATKAMSESGQRMSKEQMESTGVTRQGHFTEIDPIHKGSGKAIVYPQTAAGPTLRLENFNVTRGPDLYVYLSKNVNITSSSQLGPFHSLGKLKSSKGNQNYTLPDNFEEYKSVVIWCQAFGVLFSSATLYP